MNLDYWVCPTYDVQFALVREMGLQIEDIGTMSRAWGVSTTVRTRLPDANDDTVAAQFMKLARQAEETALTSLAKFRTEKPYLDHVPLHRFFPTVFMRIAISGTIYELLVTVNSRQVSPLVYERFVAFLQSDEVNPYQAERIDIPGRNYRFDID